uniref:NPHS1 adhesion molecule, nephrin n=1 Tax=Sinocyclocheilus rhinocerous TaxID=307959 RepID=A0A673J090_9TELE
NYYWLSTVQAFKTEPRNVTVRAGATALLKCEVLRASGAVQWVKDRLLLGLQRSLPGYPRYSMTGDQQKGQYHLQILNLSLEDDGPYECQVGRSVSSRAIVSRTAWLSVQIPPSQPYIQLESDEPWVEGDEYTVTCIAPDAKPPAEITMFRDGEELTETDSFTMSGSQDKLLNTHAEVAPVIMGLENEEVKAGSFLRLVCMSYGGNPLATLHWTKVREIHPRLPFSFSGNNYLGDNGGMMTMSNLTHKVSREDNGLFLTCEAFSKGTRFSRVRSEELNVYYPPLKVWLDAPPPNVFLHSGTTLRLVCFSSGGNPTGQLVWLKNNKVVQTASKHVYSQRGVSRELHLILQPSDNLTTYRCNSYYKANKVLTAQTKLRVLFPAVSVKIVAKQQELRRGQMLDLDCLAGSSNPTANISWSLGPLKGVDQAPDEAEFGGMSRTSKLSLTLEFHHWKKRITCQAFSNVLSEGVNNFYTLNVLFPLEFSDEQPDQVQVIEDETTALPVEVLANPDEITCEWIFQGEKLVKERDPRYHFDDWTLEMVNVSRRDGGDYIIECSNAEGKNRTKLKLDVQYTPTVRMKSDPLYVNLGDTADLLCVADANPITYSMFSWKCMGTWMIWEMSEDEGTGLLTIYEVTRNRAGVYQCTADNGISPPGSVEGQLIVRCDGGRWPAEGDGSNDANVVCQAQGVPRVHFIWAKNGFPLDLGNPRYEEKMEVTGTVHTSVLTVIYVSAALDYAVFTCTVHNSMREDSLDIQLLSTNHPDPPSDLKLLRVDHNSVTLEWMPGFDGGLTQNFRVRYQWAGSASFMYVDVFPPTATVYTVTGLNPSTTYNFSVNAISTMGESSYADNNKILTVTTADAEEADDGVSPADQDSALAGRGLPVYVVVILAVGGLLLFLNPLSCFLLAKWKRGRSLKGKWTISQETKSQEQRSTASGSTRYASRELINASAQRTLLIDSSSEPDSSVYESYGQQESTRYYYPTEVYSPALFTHPEGPEDHDGRHCTSPLAHDYEEGYSLLPPAAQFHPRAPSTYHEGRAYGKADVDVTAGVYDSMVYRRRRDTDLPFELRWELV